MDQLIPLDHRDDGTIAVSMRSLHTGLEVGKDFTSWAQRMFSCGFEENTDYAEVLPRSGENPAGGRPRRDWALTLDAAKEIAMLQRTERGQAVRRYFIAAEKELREQQPREMSGPELMARAVLEANRTIKELEARNGELTPKADAWDHIVSSAASWSYEEAVKVLFEQGIVTIGQKRLVARLVDWGYLYRDSKKRPHVYQRYLEQGLFVTKARVFTDQETGETRQSSAPQVRITGKGLDMLFRRFRSGQLAVTTPQSAVA